MCDEDKELKFRILAACYETLANSQSRKRCDALLANRVTGDVRSHNKSKLKSLTVLPPQTLSTSYSSLKDHQEDHLLEVVPLLQNVSSSSSEENLSWKPEQDDEWRRMEQDIEDDASVTIDFIETDAETNFTENTFQSAFSTPLNLDLASFSVCDEDGFYSANEEEDAEQSAIENEEHFDDADSYYLLHHPFQITSPQNKGSKSKPCIPSQLVIPSPRADAILQPTPVFDGPTPSVDAILQPTPPDEDEEAFVFEGDDSVLLQRAQYKIFKSCESQQYHNSSESSGMGFNGSSTQSSSCHYNRFQFSNPSESSFRFANRHKFHLPIRSLNDEDESVLLKPLRILEFSQTQTESVAQSSDSRPAHSWEDSIERARNQISMPTTTTTVSSLPCSSMPRETSETAEGTLIEQEYTEKAINEELGGPLELLLRARQFKPFSDPYTVFDSAMNSRTMSHDIVIEPSVFDFENSKTPKAGGKKSRSVVPRRKSPKERRKLHKRVGLLLSPSSDKEKALCKRPLTHQQLFSPNPPAEPTLMYADGTMVTRRQVGSRILSRVVTPETSQKKRKGRGSRHRKRVTITVRSESIPDADEDDDISDEGYGCLAPDSCATAILWPLDCLCI